MPNTRMRSPYADQMVKVKRLNPAAEIPRYHTTGAAGFDLAVVRDTYVHPDQIVRAPTGLVIGAPRDHMLYITFRSSTPIKWGVIVLEGIVDQDYCGDDDELSLNIMSLGKPQVKIPAGTRVAQGVFVPVTRAIFTEVNDMGESRGGFGSTG